MLPPESSLAITLHLSRQGRVERVEIGSDRLVRASDGLTGRKPEQVLAFLPTLYSLCGTAQGLAGLRAVETAAGIDAPPAQRMARHALGLAESLTEHAASVFRDWPALLGEAPDLAAVKPLRPLITAMRKALYPDGDWARPGGGRLAPDHHALDEILRRFEDTLNRLLSGPPEERLDEYSDFRAWVAHGGSPASRLLRRLDDQDMAGFGHCPPCLMPELGPHDLEERLGADGDGAYRARPDCHGRVFETGPLASHQTHPLVVALMAEHGCGLSSRFAARLVDMATSLRELEELVQDLCADSGGLAIARADGTGLGLVDAARGLLAHWVELREGVLSGYRILAPTEWNFHPEGPLAQGLLGAWGPDLEAKARLLAASLDPCVPFRIEVRGHA
ncbi:Hydrogenase maturation factor HoxV/HupK [Paramagnetospirillum magnetotacticum MS-1]|uniref:Hydrogenase maturation factor HoxV/HupK n=1 Tax=Paramagnetospirillum magnetotacticum MS-1 TaxID=272627 RepID=A0A0C2YKI1_PARME|nr:nickel-dependent hydrogenase large subunit [Paramagnetospirillum magnetotacticum]KIM00295.1 Hydrogenase maturation factor HoxV/HupK [Paramagnetospirillum magnetotacticum MS-1]